MSYRSPLSLMTAMTAAALSFTVASTAALAVSVDLSNPAWTAEGGGNWVLQNAPFFDSVLQTINGTPTVFYSPANAQNTAISGNIQVQETGGDDDFIGFVLGFNPGDLANAAANYILVDWKQGNQTLFGGTGLAGLAISQVTGALPNGSGAWWHNPAADVTELQRGANLGNVGWVDNQSYAFDISFTAANITVKVDGVEELNINGAFADGRVGFYNYSQSSVNYSAIGQAPACGTRGQPACPVSVPEPGSIGSLALFGLGLAGLAYTRRRKTA